MATKCDNKILLDTGFETTKDITGTTEESDMNSKLNITIISICSEKIFISWTCRGMSLFLEDLS